MSTARCYRVRCYFVGRDDELLAISSRLLTYASARRLLRRVKPDITAGSAIDDCASAQISLRTPTVRIGGAAYDVLDAEMFHVRHPAPLQPGVRQVDRLEDETLRKETL